MMGWITEGASIFIFVITGLMSIIGWFLKQTMGELKEVKKVAYKCETDLALLKNDYSNKIEMINEKLDELKCAIQELTHELKEINKKKI